MRRLVVFVTLLALATPFAASAAVRAPGDGTLSVRDLTGYISVRAKGGVIGRCDECTLVLNEQLGADEIAPVVSGAEKTEDTDDDGARERFEGKDLRWKVIGGAFRMVVRNGSDVDLSLVGKGRVIIRGTSGTYILNGGEIRFATAASVILRLSPTAPTP